MKVQNENQAEYLAGEVVSNQDEDAIIFQALDILRDRVFKEDYLTSPEAVQKYLTLRRVDQTREVFGIVLMDQQHGVITIEDLFTGTVNESRVYIREIVRCALKYNAASLVCYHNHPSGKTKPSQADIRITEQIKEACKIFEIRVLDHVITGGGDFYSMAQKGDM